MFERLATNPDVDVAKLEKLIAMQERIMAHNARAAFDTAFTTLQTELPEINEQGRITRKDGSTISTYAKLEDIHEAIKPIIAKHGFAIRHRTEWPADKPGIIRIVGILTHCQGHREESVFEAKADQSDYRTDIQSQGSTVSYGRRYTTIDLLNIVTRGQDKDGQAPKAAPAAPEGYVAWLAIMEGLADSGMPALTEAWNQSKREFRDYITRYEPLKWAACKTKASKK